MLKVDVVALLPELSAELVGLLEGLSPVDWQQPTSCPGWSVHALASHLLGVEVGNVSVRRDGWKLGPRPGEDPGDWLNTFNQQWVDAARRLSPALLVELISLAARHFEDYVATLDLGAIGAPVGWATGAEPAPVRLDVAREYMERFVHQYQLREATGRPRLPAHLTAPALQTAAHCLPRALAGLDRPIGSALSFVAEGDGGGSWSVLRFGTGWKLAQGVEIAPLSEVRTTVDGALRLFVRDPGAPALRWAGDEELAHAVGGAKAVLG
jgi:uncharacterized protein (TIGR03083 family)